MPHRVGAIDQTGDVAFINRPITGEPVEALKAEGFKSSLPHWYRDKIPESGKAREEFLEQLRFGRPEGSVYYDPELKANVVNQNGKVVHLSHPLDILDEEDWVKRGMIGTAYAIGQRTEEVAVETSTGVDATVINPILDTLAVEEAEAAAEEAEARPSKKKTG